MAHEQALLGLMESARAGDPFDAIVLVRYLDDERVTHHLETSRRGVRTPAHVAATEAGQLWRKGSKGAACDSEREKLGVGLGRGSPSYTSSTSRICATMILAIIASG
jgi:hypothetical protein